MKLGHKLSLAQAVLILAVLFVHAAVQVHREVRLFDRDIRRDQALTGRALSAVVQRVWESQGSDSALAVLLDSNSSQAKTKIGWRPAGSGNREPLAIVRDSLADRSLAAGQTISSAPSGGFSRTAKRPEVRPASGSKNYPAGSGARRSRTMNTRTRPPP